MTDRTLDFRAIAEKLDAVDKPVGDEKFVDYVGFNQAVEETIYHMTVAMFPNCFGDTNIILGVTMKRERELLQAYNSLTKALCFVLDDSKAVKEHASALINKMPEIQAILKTDILAAYQGDPAAKSTDEIILAYPAFTAISIYRIAHELYLRKVPLLPRKMTEHAHTMTGIDIHPGATIGKSFFIDHGTGVVIGETTVIGDRVKLYQHVTLGAKSFHVGDDGSLVKDIKRHPNIGNDVVVYAGATILGGDTYIGDNCTIGSSVWITSSVPDGETVLNTHPTEINV